MPGSSPGMTLSVCSDTAIKQAAALWRYRVRPAPISSSAARSSFDFFAGRRLAAAFRFTVFFLAFFALALRFTVLRFFFAGPTSRRAPRTAFSAAPVTALAALLAAPAAVSAALPAIDRAPSMPLRATSVIASCVELMMPRILGHRW